MKKILILLCAVFLLGGCAPKNGATVKLYFTEKGEIAEETRSVEQEGSVLETAIRTLLDGPRKMGHERVIPEGTTLLGVNIVGTVAEINLSAAFDTGTDAQRLLSRYTLIHTACSAGDVQKVKLLTEGVPLRSLQDGTMLGALGAADISLTEPGSSTPLLLTLYFPDATAAYLVPETRQITLTEGTSTAFAAVQELLRGPASSHLVSALSDKTVLLDAEIRNGICFVNMNAEFLKNTTGGRTWETAAVYSIVNTLTALPDVQEVRFLVEGETVSGPGTINLLGGFTENKSLYMPA
ncbi:MAG: GerMN domain-containing protein [Clostridia bacterium]|nr:GerMN domain-containing protein [Clostridia bacterium]